MGPACVDLTGKVAFIAGVADSTGYGWAIAKALANAGATITVGTWPPVLGIFEKSLKLGKFDDDLILDDGSKAARAHGGPWRSCREGWVAVVTPWVVAHIGTCPSRSEWNTVFELIRIHV